MISYVVRRLLLLIPVLFAVTVIVFLVFALIPGDPALAILGPYATPESLAEVRNQLQLDRSLPVRYVVWLGNVIQGDLGWAYSLDRPVGDELSARIGPTMMLAAAALIIALTLGAVAGTFAASNRNRWRDTALTGLTLLGIAIPPFWLGLMLVLVFSVRLGVLPVSGMESAYQGGSFKDVMAHLVLPAVTLSVVAAGVISRLTRTHMLEVLGQDYIRAARAKGLPESRVLWRHAYYNAAVKILPVIGTQIGFLLSGTVYVETVFQWPGLGRMTVNAILARDILLVQGGVLIMASVYVLLNLVIDIGQRMLDPRIEA